MRAYPAIPFSGLLWPQHIATLFFLAGAKSAVALLEQQAEAIAPSHEVVDKPPPKIEIRPPRNFDDVAPGDEGVVWMPITEEDTAAFAELSGDKQPVHLDNTFMAGTPYGKTIPHGLRMGSLVSWSLVECMGAGIIYESQSFRFRRPSQHGIVAVAQTIVAGKEMKPNDKGVMRYRVFLKTEVTQNGKVVIDGEAVILMSEPPTVH